MYRLLFKKGQVGIFIKQAQTKLRLTSEKLSKRIGISSRTLRDWKREKYRPNSDVINTLSRISKIKIPDCILLPEYWNVKKASALGGKRRRSLHGPFGTYESRSKGGRNSALKRVNNVSFLKPSECPDLAELIGIILGDGGLTQDQMTIYLSSRTDEKYAEYVRELIKRLFGLNASVTRKTNEHVLLVRISRVDVVKYLVHTGLCIGNKVRLQVGVPGWVNKKNTSIKACIRGLIDTDGCFIIHRYVVNKKQYQYPKMTFSNKSEPLLRFVYLELKKLGFHPRRTIKYDVWLHNQHDVKKYLRIIGTNNYKPTVKKILESGPDGKAQVC